MALSWLLLDEFTDERGTGEISGTSATPGPGTRTHGGDTVDVISGGLFQWDEWASNYNYLQYLDPAITRTAGRMLLARARLDNNKQFMIGLNQGTAPGTNYGDVQLRIKGVTVTSFVANSQFGETNIWQFWWPEVGNWCDIAIVLRVNGAFLFTTRNGYWQLVVDREIGANSPLYVYWCNFSFNNISDSQGALDFIRVPDALWLPEPLAYDSFTRSDGSLGNTETSGPDGQTITAHGWNGATWAIDTNQAKNTPNLGAEHSSGTLTVGTWYQITATETDHFYAGCQVGDTFRAESEISLDANNKVCPLTLSELCATVNVGTKQVIASVKIQSLQSGTQGGLVLWLDDPADPQNFIIAYHDGANLKVDKCVGGSWANISSKAVSFVAGARLEAVRQYSEPNSAEVIQIIYDAERHFQISAATNPTTDTYFGIFSTDPDNRLDGFLVWPDGQEGDYLPHELAVADSVHGHTADHVALAENLANVHDAAHPHTADNVTLTQVHNLVVSDCFQAQLSDNLTITRIGQAADVAVADAAINAAAISDRA